MAHSIRCRTPCRPDRTSTRRASVRRRKSATRCMGKKSPWSSRRSTSLSTRPIPSCLSVSTIPAHSRTAASNGWHARQRCIGFTTKHIYFSGTSKKLRVRYDRTVDFEPFRRRIRHHARRPDRPDRPAAGVQDRRRLVLLQPGRQPRPDVDGRKAQDLGFDPNPPDFPKRNHEGRTCNSSPLCFFPPTARKAQRLRPDKMDLRGKGEDGDPRNSCE